MAKRKPKLPLASAGRAYHLELTRADWKRLEKAYGHPLPDALRAGILESTDRFLSSAKFEQTAPNIAEAKEYISAVKKGTGELRKALLGRPGLANFKAKQLLRELTDLPSDDDADGVTYLASRTLPDLARACDAAMAELSDFGVGSFRTGVAWEVWIRELAKLLSGQGLPVGARKDVSGGSAKTVRDSSPFVALVSGLQQLIPSEIRRGSHSLDALSGMVTRARHPSGEKIAPIESDDAE